MFDKHRDVSDDDDVVVEALVLLLLYLMIVGYVEGVRSMMNSNASVSSLSMKEQRY